MKKDYNKTNLVIASEPTCPPRRPLPVAMAWRRRKAKRGNPVTPERSGATGLPRRDFVTPRNDKIGRRHFMLRGLAGFGAAFGIAGLLLPRVARARVCEKPAVGTLLGIYPVGAIYISTISTNPADLFGFGTWERFGNGRALVGVNESNANFNTVMQTGGAETHTLTTAQMPQHTHTQNSHTHTQNPHLHSLTPRGRSDVSGAGRERPFTGVHITSESYNTNNATATNQNTTATNQNTGGGGAHNNLQPYITVFIWRRTA